MTQYKAYIERQPWNYVRCEIHLKPDTMENELKTQRICRMIGCYHPVENPDNGLCAGHNRAQRKAAAPKAKPARTRIAKQSDPERHNTYMAVRTLYLAQFPNCAVCEDDGVKTKADDIHHKKGRLGDLLLDPRFFIGVCRTHHQWIEENPVDAIEAGYSLSRHQTETI